MSITIPKRVRVLNGITDPLGGSRENLLGGRYEINQIGRASGIENWLRKRDIAGNGNWRARPESL
jgi:hypothetical protein